MKIEDINRFKGGMKTAIHDWVNDKVDEIIPDKAAMRFLAKNYTNNILNRMDARLNVWLDNIFLAVADGKGVVDTDAAIDMAMGIFKEMKPFEYNIGGGFVIQAGRGELVLNMPRNAIMDALVGDIGRLRFTSDDFEEFKNLLN